MTLFVMYCRCVRAGLPRGTSTPGYGAGDVTSSRDDPATSPGNTASTSRYRTPRPAPLPRGDTHNRVSAHVYSSTYLQMNLFCKVACFCGRIKAGIVEKECWSTKRKRHDSHFYANSALNSLKNRPEGDIAFAFFSVTVNEPFIISRFRSQAAYNMPPQHADPYYSASSMYDYHHHPHPQQGAPPPATYSSEYVQYPQHQEYPEPQHQQTPYSVPEAAQTQHQEHQTQQPQVEYGPQPAPASAPPAASVPAASNTPEEPSQVCMSATPTMVQKLQMVVLVSVCSVDEPQWSLIQYKPRCHSGFIPSMLMKRQCISKSRWKLSNKYKNAFPVIVMMMFFFLPFLCSWKGHR